MLRTLCEIYFLFFSSCEPEKPYVDPVFVMLLNALALYRLALCRYVLKRMLAKITFQLVISPLVAFVDM